MYSLIGGFFEGDLLMTSGVSEQYLHSHGRLFTPCLGGQIDSQALILVLEVYRRVLDSLLWLLRFPDATVMGK